MKKVNSISGGKSSGYMAVHYPADYEVFSVVCLDDDRCRVKDPVVLKYAQEKLKTYNDRYGEFIATAEDDLTLKAMMDLEQFIGREIIWVRGKSFEKVLTTPNLHGGKPTRLPSRIFRYCTDEMKLRAIFEWWFYNIGEKCEMRIGFRFDEIERVFRFFNGQNPNGYKIPVNCSTRGMRKMKHENFIYRITKMPMVKSGVTNRVVKEYWNDKGIIWPAISNCVMCPHKQEVTIAAEAILNPEKIQWAEEWEHKDMGLWMKSLIPFNDIINNAEMLAKEVLIEMKYGHSCDTGGCTD